jgi:hypothetical protein
MICFSYCLFLFFNGNGEKRRTGSAWKRGVRDGWRWRQKGEMTQTMYAHIDK